MVEFQEKILNKEPRVRWLISGVFKPENVLVKQTETVFQPPEEIKKKIEEMWAPKAAKGWFPGSLVRVEKYDVTPEGKMELVLGNTDFKMYSGMRDRSSLRDYGYENMPNPLSTSSIIFTADNKMVILRRVAGDAAGSIDVPGGYAHPEGDLDPSSGKLDIFRAAQREVIEELWGVRKFDGNTFEVKRKELGIHEVVCLGLSYEIGGVEDLCHPVAHFVMRTSMSVEQLLAVLKSKGEWGDKEIEGILSFVDPWKLPESDDEYIIDLVRHFMGIERRKIEPDGLATISLARHFIKGVAHPNRLLKTPSQLQKVV